MRDEELLTRALSRPITYLPVISIKLAKLRELEANVQELLKIFKDLETLHGNRDHDSLVSSRYVKECIQRIVYKEDI